jgi:hypothetical protein
VTIFFLFPSFFSLIFILGSVVSLKWAFIVEVLVAVEVVAVEVAEVASFVFLVVGSYHLSSNRALRWMVGVTILYCSD